MDIGGSVVFGFEGFDSGGLCLGDFGVGVVEFVVVGECCRIWGFSDLDVVGDVCGEFDVDDL